ncbi:MAG: ComEA family DNA-binding protein [Porticoccaceae bacterium]
MPNLLNQRVVTTAFILAFIAAVYLGVSFSKDKSRQPDEGVTQSTPIPDPVPQVKIDLVPKPQVSEKPETATYDVVEVQVSTKLPINSATATEMASRLKGIGIKTAQLIVDHREQYGPFKSFDDLAAVKGIGPAKIRDNRQEITFESID